MKNTANLVCGLLGRSLLLLQGLSLTLLLEFSGLLLKTGKEGDHPGHRAYNIHTSYRSLSPRDDSSS